MNYVVVFDSFDGKKEVFGLFKNFEEAYKYAISDAEFAQENMKNETDYEPLIGFKDSIIEVEDVGVWKVICLTYVK